LKEKVKKTDKELFDLNYHVKEMDELKKLAIRNKDVESELKKQAIDESERLKKKLADKRGDLEAKFKDARQALESDDDIRLIKGKLARKDKEINDIRKKTEISENNFKRLRDEVQKLDGSLADKKQKNQEKEKKLNELKLVQNETAVALRET
jgi:chromosome segregation ATPase